MFRRKINKNILLKLIFKYSKYDREFRIKVCRELIMARHQEIDEQTGFGRFYQVCGEMFESVPEYMLYEDCDVKGGVMDEFDETKQYLKNKPRRDKLKRILQVK